MLKSALLVAIAMVAFAANSIFERAAVLRLSEEFRAATEPPSRRV